MRLNEPGIGFRAAAPASPWVRCFGLCFAVLVSITACSQANKTTTISWREETRLSTGQVIVVGRSHDFHIALTGTGGSGLLFQNASIRAVLPPLNQEILWQGTLKPLALDIANNGDIYLVTTWETLQNKAENAVPEGVAHVAFKYAGSGQWIRLPVESVPHEIHPNLLIDEVALFDRDGYKTKEPLQLEMKEKLNTNPAYDKSIGSRPAK